MVLSSFTQNSDPELSTTKPNDKKSQITASLYYAGESRPCTIQNLHMTLNVYGPSSYVSYCVTNLNGCT